MLLKWFLSAALLYGGAALFLPGPLLPYVHDNGLSARRRLPENMGPGVAILDFNADGRMDIAFPTALFRNDGDGRFTDVTAASGLDSKAFGIGVVAADYDLDGLPDLVVTTWGTPCLYRNLGNGRFAATRIGEPGLWTAAVVFDADADGLPDLYLGHFAAYDPAAEPACKYNGVFHYCHPLSYGAHTSRFYRNVGKGQFVPVENALSTTPGKVFGAVATDIDNDGLLDLFVANDSVANFLFRNRGNFEFEEIGLAAGVAFSADGNPRSGMGVDAADFDQDGREDLFVANFNRERFSIYRNRDGRIFSDEAGSTGIGMATQMYSGWGVKFFDRDHDGDLDLLLVNGHPDDRIETLSQTLTWKEPVLYLENRGGRYVATEIGKSLPARGLALADFDNDGHHDALIANNGAAPVLLRGTATAGNHWLGVDHRGLVPGAMVRWSIGGRVRQHRINSPGSYLSSGDPRVILGLGPADAIDWLEMQVPRQPTVRTGRLQADRYYVFGR
jgi:enediyne biosynthesis protein E4